LPPCLGTAFGSDQYATSRAEELLVETAGNPISALEKESQTVEVELIESKAACRTKAEPDPGPHVLQPLDADGRECARAAEVLCLGELDRPENSVVTAAVLARCPFAFPER